MKSLQMQNNHSVAVVDIFCGAGGLTHGFIQEGFNVVAGIDFDGTCQYPYEFNNHTKFINADILTLSATTVKRYLSNASTKIIIGCAPCQPFSTYNNGDRKKDNKWRLLYRFAKIIKAVSPDIFSMENVPALETFDRGKVLNDFIMTLGNAGYTIKKFIVNCPEYAIPQQRKRLVVMGSKYGTIELIPPICKNPQEYKTVRETISHLPPINAGEISATDHLHRAAGLTKLNLARIQASIPGGTWRDWPENLVANCHKKTTGATFSSVYGRMAWDLPAPTITTLCFGYGNGRFGHPEQNRAISLREAALLQTFPETYQFTKEEQIPNLMIVGRQIGNAVPVKLGRIIAQSIAIHIHSIGRTL